MTPKLVTLAEWRKLQPREQGYVLYMQANWPGSELAGQTCPYRAGSPEHEQWRRGEHAAVLVAQDSEE